MSQTSFNDYSGKPLRAVTVYGSSTTKRGTPQWEEARRTGMLVAQAGFSVVTGGYCGSMEAVSEGARAGGAPEVVGVTVSSVFPQRDEQGNAFLTRQIDAATLMERLHYLTSMTRYYIALPGSIGSLQEILNIWTLSLLHGAGLPRPVIILFREPWELCLRNVSSTINIEAATLQILRFVDTPEEALEIIVADDKSHGVS
ncbi:putative lysine decarboxylase [Trypanosoma vivax]|uniref:Putative ribosomal protein L32-like protein n=1 Tax=Trypanosoma vivax (strain Y486) TaxID=1055687 RepID=G0U3S2_TRYVY|nr:putative ribosomal protein L32-like protein [Trypanosoma vivax]KAH8613576.1 putative lysine decarboxylase [Trypanosoma vivax]CCC50931.1 putative ribosomal protein L32-like protein [Trypanosoma vivax Y486]